MYGESIFNFKKFSVGSGPLQGQLSEDLLLDIVEHVIMLDSLSISYDINYFIDL